MATSGTFFHGTPAAVIGAVVGALLTLGIQQAVVPSQDEAVAAAEWKADSLAGVLREREAVLDGYAASSTRSEDVIDRLNDSIRVLRGMVPAPPPPPDMVRRVRDFEFVLSGCDREAAGVRCTFTVTNLVADRKLAALCNTDAFGDTRGLVGDGVEHTCEGTQTAGGRVSGGSSTFDFVEGEPISVAFVFDTIPSSAEAFTTVDFMFRFPRDESFPLRFRSLPIRS